MNLFAPIISKYLKRRIKAIQKFQSQPISTQESLLADLINVAKDTEWGVRYDFKSMESPRDFCSRIPVQDYNGFKTDIERLMMGEQNILWPSRIKWFAKSSGTTSERSKFIPVSKEALDDCHFKGAKDIMCSYLHHNPQTQVFNGKSLIMGGSQRVHDLNTSTHYGDVSAVMMKNQPFLANLLRTPDLSVALMDNWEEKIVRIAAETRDQNITNLAGVPTWTLVLIKHILSHYRLSHISEIWPNLELYMHGGVSFAPYIDTFQSLLGDKVKYYQVYNASEGFLAFQDENDRDDMLLALDHGIYFEFIAPDEWDRENPATMGLSEVETNKNYALVITTNAGLWRYKIGDTIKFTSLDPFRIKVSGRTKHFINAFGEEVIIENADYAVKSASMATNAAIREYTVAPIYFGDKSKAAHQWLIEFSKQPENTEEFTLLLDEALRSVNSDYDAKRQNDMALTLPKLTIAKTDLFYTWLKNKNKLGGQHKIPRLCNDRTYMDQLLQLM